jgi:hypothetical protein
MSMSSKAYDAEQSRMFDEVRHGFNVDPGHCSM